MGFGKRTSLIVGLTGVVASGAALLLCVAIGFDGIAGFATAVLAAAVVGAAVGGAQWLTMQRWFTEVHALAAHVETLCRIEIQANPFRAKTELGEVAEAIDRSVGGLRKRVEQVLSQRRELEIQARIAEAERQHAEAILNSITDAVVVTDSFNEVALVNEAASRILNFDLEQAARKPVDRVVNDVALIKLIKDTREGGGSSRRRHVEHKMVAGGHTSTYDVTLSCIADEQKHGHAESAGVVTILRDITREKEIAEMKSDFVANVSHELRTPLSSIKAYMEMLVDGEAHDDTTRAEFYNIVQGEANRLSRLIDNILNINRIESGVVKVQREHISLPQLIKEVLDVMLPQARAKQIELVEVPTPLFFQVFADKDMIYQTLLNLIGNAVKYTLPGGKVTVAVSVDEHAHMVNVSVADSGVGVPAADLPHLFEKFYRVAEHKKLAKGTGLGLNLVKHIVETVHGGNVSVTSEIGKGSTFTFSLPMADNR